MAPLRLVPYGPEAAFALRDAVAAAKRGDPLAPVTVAVPSNYAGLSLRRRLGAGDLSLAAVSRREGLVNVRFLVLARVAELLGAPALATQGRRPLIGAVRVEAIRAALAADPGVFRDVLDHAATERSLDSTLRDLRRAPSRALDAVAARSERAAHVVRLHREVRRHTEAYYDEEDLAETAARAVRDRSPALRDVGHVVLYLPRQLSPAERALVEALARAGRLTAIVGLTGDGEADGPARRLVSLLEGALGPAEEASCPPPPAGTAVVAVADAEEEVRTALRLVLERLAQGTPLHRMAVLYPSAQLYALLAHEQFAAAGVPHNGPAVRTLAQSLSGRTLLGLLRLREADLRRDALMDWLSAAPVLEEARDRPAPAHRWDTLSRAAGVVRGAPQWRDRLARYARSRDEERAALERMDEADEARLRGLATEAAQARRLARFVDELATRLSGGRTRSWTQLASWARELLDRYLGGEGHRRGWPEEEIEAHRAVEAAVDALSGLDDLGAPADEAAFRRALERELEAPAGRIGRFGDGVFIGRIYDALGADFEAVFLVGMSEGIVPPRARDDPLLPDRERSAAGEELPRRTERRADDRRDYLAALASAPERTLIFPRADLRGQRGKLPAHWLLETASRLEGRTLFSADLERLERPWHTVVPSFEAALKDGLEVASEQEYALRSLVRWRDTGAPAADHYLARETPVLRAGIEAELARRAAALTRWDGGIAGAAGAALPRDRPVSPTALQTWAACPFRYLLGHVLRVAETEKPEETLSLSALERGNLIHRALELFIREAPPRRAPDEPWSASERARLLEIGRRLCDGAEAGGLAGKPLLWRLQRARILRDLAGFLEADERMRADQGVVPAQAELSFGVPGAAPLTVPLPDGGAVAFRGRVDRVDRSPDGARLVVLDYKSGVRGRRYRDLARDAVVRGQLLQLPIYGLAAQERYGAAAAGYYWFVNEEADYALDGYPLGGRELERFREAVQVILAGIQGGLFPARPGARTEGGFENCAICPYDRVCPRDREAVWGRKRAAPPLRPYLDLAEPEDGHER